MIAIIRRIGVNAGWLLLGKAFGGVLSIVYLALATRMLGLTDFGRFALVVAIGQTVAGFVGFQTWQFVVRYAMPAQAAGDEAAIARVIGFAAVLDLGAGLAGSVIALVAIVMLSPFLGLPADLMVAAWTFCLAILVAVRSTPTGVMRLDDRFRDAAAVEAVTPLVRVVGAAVAAIFSPTVTAFLIAWSVAELVTAAVSWRTALSRRRLAVSLAGLRQTHRDDPSLWRFLLATNLSSSLSMTVRQVTLLAVGGVAGPAAAGTFRLAAQLAQALAKLTQSFARAAYGEIVRSLANGHGQEYALLMRLTAIAGGVAIAMVALAAAIGQPVLALIAGPAFAGAYLPIVLLVAAAALDLGGFAFEPAMTAHGQAGRAFGMRTVAMAFQAALLAALLPSLGVVGGAWATLGGSAAALGLTGWGAVRAARRAEASRSR